MTTEARQSTLSLIEELVTRYIGTQRQGALEMIACEIDNHIDRLLKEQSRVEAEQGIRANSKYDGDSYV